MFSSIIAILIFQNHTIRHCFSFLFFDIWLPKQRLRRTFNNLLRHIILFGTPFIMKVSLSSAACLVLLLASQSVAAQFTFEDSLLFTGDPMFAEILERSQSNSKPPRPILPRDFSYNPLQHTKIGILAPGVSHPSGFGNGGGLSIPNAGNKNPDLLQGDGGSGQSGRNPGSSSFGSHYGTAGGSSPRSAETSEPDAGIDWSQSTSSGISRRTSFPGGGPPAGFGGGFPGSGSGPPDFGVHGGPPDGFPGVFGGVGGGGGGGPPDFGGSQDGPSGGFLGFGSHGSHSWTPPFGGGGPMRRDVSHLTSRSSSSGGGGDGSGGSNGSGPQGGPGKGRSSGPKGSSSSGSGKKS